MTLPTLYKKTSTGAIQQWTVEVELVEPQVLLITTWGQVEGQAQSTEEFIKSKNTGKTNETTPEAQALKEAKARWTKQLKKGYVESIQAAQAGEVDDIIEGGVVPMLAHVYEKHADKVRYPCFVQPKLDGHRCIAVVKEGFVTLWSRTRKPITSMWHLDVELLALGDGTYDGELFHEDMTFEELTGYIRSPKPTEGSDSVEYHVYDLVHPTHPYVYRHDLLEERFAKRASNVFVCRVDTFWEKTEKDIRARAEMFVQLGYEGLMVRNADGLYKHGRSYDLLKVKTFEDGEFLVTSVKEGKGKLAGHAVFTCVKRDPHFEQDDLYFDVKMKGPQAELKQYFEDHSKAVGRFLTVKHQGLTDKGVPRFPVGLRWREEL